MKKMKLMAIAAAMLTATSAMAQVKQVKTLYTTGSTLNVEQLANTQQTAQLSRYFFEGCNTLCLPMSISTRQLSEKMGGEVRLERLAAIAQEGTTLCLYFVDCTSDGVEAGMPYLCYAPKAVNVRIKNTEATSLGAQPIVVRMTDRQGNTVSFGSSWSKVMQEGRYGIPAKQETTPLQSVLISTEADKVFYPTRCGFDWEAKSSTAEELVIRHLASESQLAEVTAIQQAQKNGTQATVDVYDMKGNLLRKQVRSTEATKSLPRGIYVVGGEKVSVQ